MWQFAQRNAPHNAWNRFVEIVTKAAEEVFARPQWTPYTILRSAFRKKRAKLLEERFSQRMVGMNSEVNLAGSAQGLSVATATYTQSQTRS